MSRRRYLVQRTDRTGHWRTLRTCLSERAAIIQARQIAKWRRAGRRRVTVQVWSEVCCGEHQQPCSIAGWINGFAAWGEAF
jgi:hypothetical protein